MRSRLRATNSRFRACGMMGGLALHEAHQLVKERASRRSSTASSESSTLRASSASRVTNASSALRTMDSTSSPMCGISISGFTTGSSHQGQGPLRDVDRQVAHALQVVVDLDGGGDEAQIPRHGLVQRQQAGGEIVDLDLHLVDARFVPQDLFGQFSRSFCTTAVTLR